MSQAECERQVCIEKEKASQEAQHAAQAEADVRHVREVLDESLSGTVKRIAETMESFAKRSRMEGDEEHGHPLRPPMRDF